MSVSFKYWDDCVEAEDMEAMWNDPQVCTEWIAVGETKGQKVHLSRDPDGQAFLTQTEMMAVAGIIVRRHFSSQIDPVTICAIAELESDRQLLAMRYDKKTKQTTVGIMQILPKTADSLATELGFRGYEVEGNSNLLYRPFVSVYLGAAYLKWLSNFEEKERNEEFVVRAYRTGTKKATHKSTLPYWKRYLSVKERLPFRKYSEDASYLPNVPALPVASPPSSAPALTVVPTLSNAPALTVVPTLSNAPVLPLPPGSSRPTSQVTGDVYTYWDSRTSPEDMEDMWNHPVVVKEWTKSGEKHGKVRFSHDAKKRPYLSQIELKAVAEIILFRHFSSMGVKPAVLCAIAEIVSMRFVNGVGSRTGIMGIDFQTATWLYKELGYKAYNVNSEDDLKIPFVSMYFGATYMAWLSGYEGSERSPEFVVQAYIAGPTSVNLEENNPIWLKFKDALSIYGDSKRDQGSCSIL